MSKLPTAYVKNYVSSLLKAYGHSCPVMSRFINVGSSTSTNVLNEQIDSKKKCPFLEDGSTSKVVKEVSAEIQEDVITQKEKVTGYHQVVFLSFVT